MVIFPVTLSVVVKSGTSCWKRNPFKLSLRVFESSHSSSKTSLNLISASCGGRERERERERE